MFLYHPYLNGWRKEGEKNIELYVTEHYTDFNINATFPMYFYSNFRNETEMNLKHVLFLHCMRRLEHRNKVYPQHRYRKMNNYLG